MQVDGAFGISAAIAEMVLQSQEDGLNLLPALPDAWKSGEVSGLCARGGFEVGLVWSQGRLDKATVLSRLGNRCRVRSKDKLTVMSQGREVTVKRLSEDVIEFQTTSGAVYELSRM